MCFKLLKLVFSACKMIDVYVMMSLSYQKKVRKTELLGKISMFKKEDFRKKRFRKISTGSGSGKN